MNVIERKIKSMERNTEYLIKNDLIEHVPFCKDVIKRFKMFLKTPISDLSQDNKDEISSVLRIY